MAKYSFTSVDSAEVEIDGYVFKVKGLSRQDALNFISEVAELETIEDLEEKAKKAEELDKKLFYSAIEDEKGRDLVLNKASIKVYRKILDLIMELSGLGEETEKNSESS